MQKSKTYFEQIPVELVKKIAEEDVPDDNINGNDGTVARILTNKRKPHPLPSLRKNTKGV
jgi:hypothetical protein